MTIDTTQHRDRISIYGLFDNVTGICYYVGQSCWTSKRREQHFNPTRGRARQVPNAAFRVLAEVRADEDPKLVEREFIARYKALGQATLNSDRPAQNYKTSAYYTIIWVERGVVFRGFGQVARAIGCTPQTVSNLFKGGLISAKYSSRTTLRLLTWPTYFTPTVEQNSEPTEVTP